jgi:hypothetical protein
VKTVHEICKVVLLSLVAAGLVAFLLWPVVRRWLATQEGRTAATMVSVQRALLWSGAYLFGTAWIVDALVTDETSLKRVTATRAHEPFLFWFIVGTVAFLMVITPFVLLSDERRGPAAVAPSMPAATELRAANVSQRGSRRAVEPVRVFLERGRVCCDVMGLDTWKGFEDIAYFLRREHQVELLERLDGPEGSRRWVLSVGGPRIELQRDDNFGNVLVSLSPKTDDVVRTLAISLDRALREGGLGRASES